MKTRIIIILFVLSFITIPAFGQIALEWGLLPQADGDDLLVPFDKSNVTANDFKISIGLPLIYSTTENNNAQDPSFVLLGNVFYGNKHLEVNNWPYYTLDSEQNYTLNLTNTYDHLVSFGGSIIAIKKLSEKWSLLGIGGFTYAGINPDKYRTEDMGLAGGFSGIRKWNKKWSFGLGLLYSRLTGADAVLPMIIIERETEKSTLAVTLPSEFKYWYHQNKKISFGLTAQLEGDMYDYTGLKVNQYDESGNLESTDNKVGLAYSSLTLGPAIKLSSSFGVALVIRAGIAMTRRYQYWLPKEKEMLRYGANPDYEMLTGHDYSGEEIDFPMKKTGFIKVTVGIGL